MVKDNIQNPLIYFIILNYCSYEDTIECFNTIKNIKYENSKTIVLDNNSPDGSGELLCRDIGGSEFIQLNKNFGYTGGNNHGIQIALKDDADYLFIVNPDVRFQPDSIENYIKAFEEDKKIGALNPVQTSSSEGFVDERFKNSVLRHVQEDFIKINLGKNIVIETETLLGAALLLSREAIEKVGGFDPLYFAYGEEIDLCRRLKYSGFKLCVTFNSPVIHLRNYSNKNLDNFREYLRLKGRYLYILKDSSRSSVESLKGFLYELRADIVSKKFKNKKIIYLKMIGWSVINYFKILKSKDLEKNQMAHLSLD